VARYGLLGYGEKLSKGIVLSYAFIKNLPGNFIQYGRPNKRLV
jgi:hypothetical protein